MSHTTTRIYTEEVSNVRHGVSFADVQAVLETGDNDEGLLCTNDRINKWAKYRPIEKNNYKGLLTDALRKAQNWGIGNIPIWDNGVADLGKMVNFWSGDDTSSPNLPDCGLQVEYWTRILPSTFFRIRDFAADVDNKGYFHGAVEPITPITGSIEISVADQLDVVFGQLNTDPETIHIYDFDGFDNLYFGVVFYNPSYGTYIATQDTKVEMLESMGYGIHIHNPDALAGKTWKVWPCLSSTEFSTGLTHNVNNTGGPFVALLDWESISVTIHYLSYGLNADYARLNGRSIEYQFTFRNYETGTGVSSVILALEFRDSNNNVLDAAQLTIGNVGPSSYVSAQGAHVFQNPETVYSVYGHIHSMSAVNYQDIGDEAIVGAPTPY